MRLREQDLQTVFLKKRAKVKDNEGVEKVGYSSDYTLLRMNVQSAGGSVAAQIYGDRLPYIKSCKYQGDELKEGQNEKDGVCVYVDSNADPDFFIKSIQSFSTHLNIMLERL